MAAKKSAKKTASKKKTSAKKATVKKKTSPKKAAVKKTESVEKPQPAEKKQSSDWKTWLVSSILIIVIIAIAILIVKGMQEPVEQGVLVTVNDQPIFAKEIDDQYDRLPEQLREQFTKEQILDQMIDKVLILQYGDAQGIEISDEAVDARVEEVVASLGISVPQLQNLLEQQGVLYEEYWDAVKEELILNKIAELMLSDNQISDEEVEQYYEDNLERYGAKEGEIRVKHILVDTEELAQDLMQQARDGADFAELAKEHSTGPSSVSGGDLGFISEQSQLVEEFKAAALVLQVGEVSDPTQTQFGWHVIKRDTDLIPLQDVKEDITRQLGQESGAAEFQQVLQQLKEEAEIKHHKKPE